MFIVVIAYYMHHKSEAGLLPLDTKIKRTLRNLKNLREVEKVAMAEQRDVNQNIPIAVVGALQ